MVFYLHKKQDTPDTMRICKRRFQEKQTYPDRTDSPLGQGAGLRRRIALPYRQKCDRPGHQPSAQSASKVRQKEHRQHSGYAVAVNAFQAGNVRRDGFHFTLTNFCIMQTHIHLLIKPARRQNLATYRPLRCNDSFAFLCYL